MFDETLRQKVAELCFDRGQRITGANYGIPNGWHPSSVLHPQTYVRFSNESAFEFLADCLEAGIEVKPKAKNSEFEQNAYYMLDSGGKGQPLIYMSFALIQNDRILGLSFHYERYERPNR